LPVDKSSNKKKKKPGGPRDLGNPIKKEKYIRAPIPKAH